MADTAGNPNDPEFLVSRSLDERLSDIEAEKLRANRESSPYAARFAQDLAHLDDLVKEWGAAQVKIDEAAFVEGVLGRIADEHAREFSRVDEALHAWREQDVEVVEGAFVADVSRRLRETTKETATRSWVYHLRRPLAVAAAITLVITAVSWFQFSGRPVVEVSIQRSVFDAGGSNSAAFRASRIVVFERTTMADASMSRERGRASFMVIGAESGDEEIVAAPPL